MTRYYIRGHAVGAPSCAGGGGFRLAFAFLHAGRGTVTPTRPASPFFKGGSSGDAPISELSPVYDYND